MRSDLLLLFYLTTWNYKEILYSISKISSEEHFIVGGRERAMKYSAHSWTHKIFLVFNYFWLLRKDRLNSVFFPHVFWYILFSFLVVVRVHPTQYSGAMTIAVILSHLCQRCIVRVEGHNASQSLWCWGSHEPLRQFLRTLLGYTHCHSVAARVIAGKLEVHVILGFNLSSPHAR